MTSRGQLTVLVGAIAAMVLLSAGRGDAQNKSKVEVVRYDHESHGDRGLSQKNCKTCHVLDDKFIAGPPNIGKNHQPCNDSKCHESEFMSKKPVICVVCHDSAEPWVKQPARLRNHKRSEFGGDLSHKTHATARVGGRGQNGPCRTCHGDVYKGTAPTSGGGHANCANCHGKTAQPAMGDCGSCHIMGARSGRLAAKRSEWSVAPLFTHTTHGADPRKPRTETACITCHTSIPKATKLAQVKKPTMRSCDSCHNGKAAFKTTGFQCYRCHGDGKTPGSAGKASK